MMHSQGSETYSNIELAYWNVKQKLGQPVESQRDTIWSHANSVRTTRMISCRLKLKAESGRYKIVSYGKFI